MEKAAIILFLLALSQVFAQDCTLVVPPNPLSATGLATPYRLLAPCNQSDPMMATFVQGAVLDVAAGKMYVYNPLVITDGTQPLVQPVLPALPGTPVVGLWFGTNAGTVTLVDNAGSLAAGNCINGIAGSIFGQFAYCNAVSFFAAAYGAINAGILVVPPLGTAADGEVCPSIRDFFIIDMDQSDNVVTEYIVVGTTIAQMTTANKGIFTGANKLTNGSDNRLLSIAIDGALGCIPWRAPDLADNQNTVGLPALPLLEIQAAKYQANPALVPISHAMARVNNQPNLDKVNAYRAGVGQTPAAKVTDADSLLYCQNFYYTAPRRLSKNQAIFFNAGSPDPVLATNLFAFLGQRFAGAFGPDGLNCANLLNVAPPVVPVKNAAGVFVGATITVPQQPGAPAGAINQNTIIIIVVCSVGGVLLIAGLIVGVIWYRNRSMYS